MNAIEQGTAAAHNLLRGDLPEGCHAEIVEGLPDESKCAALYRNGGVTAKQLLVAGGLDAAAHTSPAPAQLNMGGQRRVAGASSSHARFRTGQLAHPLGRGRGGVAA
jgi:hypothetical protein